MRVLGYFLRIQILGFLWKPLYQQIQTLLCSIHIIWRSYSAPLRLFARNSLLFQHHSRNKFIKQNIIVYVLARKPNKRPVSKFRINKKVVCKCKSNDPNDAIGRVDVIWINVCLKFYFVQLYTHTRAFKSVFLFPVCEVNEFWWLNSYRTFKLLPTHIKIMLCTCTNTITHLRMAKCFSHH